MFRNVVFTGAPRISPRRMKKGAAGAPGPIDNVLGKNLKVFRIVVGFVAHHFNQTTPAMAEAYNLISFAKRAESDPSDRRIEAGNVAASGQDTDDALLILDVSHGCAFVGELNRRFYTSRDETEGKLTCVLVKRVIENLRGLSAEGSV